MRHHLLKWLPWLMLASALPAQTSRVDNIEIYGNYHSRTGLILRQMRTRPGQLFSQHTLLEDRRWLLRQRLFNKVDIEVLPGSKSGSRTVRLVVEERGRLGAAPLLRRDVRYGLTGGLAMTFSNLLGFKQRWQIKGQAGGEPLASLEWCLPPRSTPFWIGLSAGWEHLRRPYRSPWDGPDFDRKRTERYIRLTLPLHRRWEISVHRGALHHEADIAGVTFSGRQNESLTYSEISSELDTRDWPDYPRQGQYTFVSARQYHPCSVRQYEWRGQSYWPLMGRSILALQGHLQFSSKPVPRLYKYHLGSGQTIRGIFTDELSGDHAAHVTVEYRIPMVYARHPLAGLHAGYAWVFFIDSGSAWADGTNLNKTRWVTAVGLGAHAIWDNIIIRAEYGYRGQGWGFLSGGTGVKF